MRIGIIGSGKIGSTIGRLWVEAGHQVRFSSRHPERLASFAKGLGERASTGTPEDAAGFGEVVLVSVPYQALPDVGRELASALAGKIVLETGNPYSQRKGDVADTVVQSGLGTGVWLARFLPGAPGTRLQHRVGQDAREGGPPLG